MVFYLIILFTVVPVVELMLLVRIAAWSSWPATIALVLVTGVIGAKLARREGIKTLRRIQTDLANGIPPTTTLVDGALILLAGAVLITPGVITDLCGFLLLVPAVRAGVTRRLADALKRHVMVSHVADAFDTHAGPDTGFIDVPASGRDADEPPPESPPRRDVEPDRPPEQ